jgi:hypothetical protein
MMVSDANKCRVKPECKVKPKGKGDTKIRVGEVRA